MTSWTLSRRLLAGFGSLLLVIALLGVLFEIALRSLQKDVATITDRNFPGMIASSEALENALNYRVLTLQHLLTDDAAERTAIEAECETLAGQTLENLATYEKTISTEVDRAFFAKVGPAFARYRDVAKQIRQLNSTGDRAAAQALANGDAAKAFTAYEMAVIELTSFNENFARENSEKIGATMTRTRTIASVLGGGGAALAILASVLITRRVNRAIGTVADALTESSAHVADAAAQVSSASQALAAGASVQASSLEETSASLEAMAEMTKRSARSAQQAKEVSAQTRASADAGAAHMDEMRRAMDAIKASSDDIAKIIKTIDEIAFQTNILALNAAVEAARAGEAGMGFAVVAEEVRNLAQRSAQSAKETALKIEDAIRKSEHGVAISGSVADALGDIAAKARRVDAFVAEIAQATKEQSQGIDQLNSSVGQMDRVTQSNAGNAEESAAAAEELAQQAEAMRSAVADLEALLHGGREARAVPADDDARGTSDAPGSALPQRPDATDADADKSASNQPGRTDAAPKDSTPAQAAASGVGSPDRNLAPSPAKTSTAKKTNLLNSALSTPN